jgi:hypothetical protein
MSDATITVALLVVPAGLTVRCSLRGRRPNGKQTHGAQSCFGKDVHVHNANTSRGWRCLRVRLDGDDMRRPDWCGPAGGSSHPPLALAAKAEPHHLIGGPLLPYPWWLRTGFGGRTGCPTELAHDLGHATDARRDDPCPVPRRRRQRQRSGCQALESVVPTNILVRPGNKGDGIIQRRGGLAALDQRGPHRCGAKSVISSCGR